MQCPTCHYQWEAKKPNPKRCPRCQRWLQPWKGSAIERFWSKVRITETCWLWTSSLTCRDGYGQFGTVASGKRTNHVAHRFAYETVIGPIPEGLELDHLCRTRICVNPDHLEPVTAKVNSARSFSVSGLNARKTHCPKGHAYDLANTSLSNGGGGRRCQACHREHSRMWRNAHPEYGAEYMRALRLRPKIESVHGVVLARPKEAGK